MSTTATPARPKSDPTKYVILRLVDVDGAQLWEVCATGEGDPKKVIREFIESNPDRQDELLASHYQGVPARSWLEEPLSPKPKIVF